MTTSQIMQLIRDNISSIAKCRLQETLSHHIIWCEAQISLAHTLCVISMEDRKELAQAIEEAKLCFAENRKLKEEV